MKKLSAFPVLFLFLMILVACAAPAEESVMIGNPWTDYDTLKQAETAVGFSLDIPQEIDGEYRAEAFRVMNNELLEVIYHNGTTEVTVRKIKGEDQDISGVYLEFDAVTEEEHDGMPVTVMRSGDICLMLFSPDGYSYSIYAPDGFAPTSPDGFFRSAFGQH